jgi:hypothetical protein
MPYGEIADIKDNLNLNKNNIEGKTTKIISK